ncbi:MAG: YebC/PmpR family DNA-binding transcriptional regulator, partial [Planctomycetales bacterium]|nr:YebC/PmpR family DNA-binding transcriptional regulator [Planctomycetales bacterium]
DNIERAIKKGTGELEGGNLETVMYEGHGPSGVAVMCEILTDNRNRTAPEVRKIFELNGGKLGATGCAAWMFDRKGIVRIPADKTDEESLLELGMEAGAEDVRPEGDQFEMITSVDAFSTVCDAVEAAGIEIESREVAWLPKDTVELTADDARKVLKMMEALDDHDDVQSVAANFDIPDEVMAEME